MTKQRTFSALIAATLTLGATAAHADQPAAPANPQDLQKQLEALQLQVRNSRASRPRAECPRVHVEGRRHDGRQRRP